VIDAAAPADICDARAGEDLSVEDDVGETDRPVRKLKDREDCRNNLHQEPLDNRVCGSDLENRAASEFIYLFPFIIPTRSRQVISMPSYSVIRAFLSWLALDKRRDRTPANTSNRRRRDRHRSESHAAMRCPAG